MIFWWISGEFLSQFWVNFVSILGQFWVKFLVNFKIFFGPFRAYFGFTTIEFWSKQGSTDRPVRIGPRFSKFCWSWFGPVWNFQNSVGPWIPGSNITLTTIYIGRKLNEIMAKNRNFFIKSLLTFRVSVCLTSVLHHSGLYNFRRHLLWLE